MLNHKTNRRLFVKEMALLSAAALVPSLAIAKGKGAKMKLGLVTYQWGKDWDCPTLIKNCIAAKIYGVELRIEHAHKVEPTISAERRKEVKKMFADSAVKIIGMGTNQQYDFIEPDKLSNPSSKPKSL